MPKIKCDCKEWVLSVIDVVVTDMDKIPLFDCPQIHGCKKLLVYQKKTGRSYFFEIPFTNPQLISQ